jgi:ribonuclease HII
MQKYKNDVNEIGLDEAGRGPLIGRVYAGAVIWDQTLDIPDFIKDSKKLNSKKRAIALDWIKNNIKYWGVGYADEKEIDKINILNASIKAMQQCIIKLNPTPNYVIVDGNRFKPINNIPFSTIIKGDGKYLSIAAASVLAKTYRDEYMDKIHEEFPMYNWKKNKGYPTIEHREAIRKYGVTKYHRMSFRLLPEQLKLDL